VVTNTQIPIGYKQIELGVIPDEWDIKRLGDIGKSIIGLTYSPSDVVSYGKLVHRSSNIRDNRLLYDDNVYVKKVFSQKLILKENDILICVRNGSRNLIGKSALIIGKSIGETFGAFMSVFRSDKYQPFIFYLIVSNIVQKQINQSLGATINQITNKTLNDFLIPYPLNPEERIAITTVLSDIDALIEQLKNLIAKKKAIKQGLMHQLLTGKKRLLGFSGKWEVKKLGEIANVIGGGTPSTYNPSYWNGMINWFTPTEIGLNKYTYTSIRKITEEGLANCSARILQKGAILLTTRAGIGDVSILMNEGCTNQGFQSLVANDDESYEFLYYLVSTLKNVLIQNASGSTFLEISPNRIKQIEVKIPNLKEQTAIANILSDMDAEIEKLKQKRDKYQMLKQGVMQQLLTGKIRLL